MKYIIFAREIHIQRYKVEADTINEAVEKFNDGDGELDGSMEYSHIDGYTHVEDDEGHQVAEGDDS